MLDKKQVAAAAALLMVGAAAASGGQRLPFFSAADDAPETLGSRTADGVFVGWEGRDDEVDAVLALGGRAAGARVVSPRINHFLEAHRGLPISVQIDRVRIVEDGQAREVDLITDARVGSLTAAAWWASLPAHRREAAERRTEQALAAPGLVQGVMHALQTMMPAPVAAAATGRTLHVDANAGNDSTGDGLAPQTAFRTIGRALAEVPSVVDDFWTIRLAAGNYGESVELRRFAMPSMLSNSQLRFEPIPRAIALVGPTTGTAAIVPPSGSVCLSGVSVLVFLDSLTCRPSGANGVSIAGSTLVMDDVAVETSAAGGTYGVHAETSVVYLGGSFAVTGPFEIGLAARVNSLARTGTRRNPGAADLSFSGIVTQAIFLRDGGNFTSAFESGTIRIADSGQAIYALLGSRVFIASTIRLEMNNVRRGVAASQFSSVNASDVVLTGPMPNPFVACHKGSYVSLERVTAATPRPMDTDGTCSLIRF